MATAESFLLNNRKLSAGERDREAALGQLAALNAHTKALKEKNKGKLKYLTAKQITDVFAREFKIDFPSDNYPCKYNNDERQVREFLMRVVEKYPVNKAFRKHAVDFIIRILVNGSNYDHRVPYEQRVNDKIFTGWYLNLARGGSFANETGTFFTKKEAHSFLQADWNTSIGTALWLHKLYSIGVDKDTAKHLVDRIFTRSIMDASTVAAWERDLSLMYFAKKHPFSEFGEDVQQVLDYMRTRGNTYSYKGRTPNTIIELTNEWHLQLQHTSKKDANELISFPESAIKTMTFTREDSRGMKLEWLFEHINNNHWLFKEGRAMHHCVGSYARYCQEGTCEIFSARYGGDRMFTVEISNSRSGYPNVRQARGYCNKKLTGFERNALEYWAHKNNIRLEKNV